jgi:hypothetical protein
MIDIPPDVRVRVAAKLYSVVNRDDSFRLADAIIPLAQLPIAPATEDEARLMQGDFYRLNAGSGLSKHETMTVLNQFISRRNSPPPKCDPRVAVILAVLDKQYPDSVPSQVARRANVADKILAALDAMKEKG